jgi:hypothetical protein
LRGLFGTAAVVRRFAERHDARVADDAGERSQIVKSVARDNRLQRNRARLHPLGRRLFLGGRRCRHNCAREYQDGNGNWTHESSGPLDSPVEATAGVVIRSASPQLTRGKTV